jgi:hypothetical protein
VAAWAGAAEVAAGFFAVGVAADFAALAEEPAGLGGACCARAFIRKAERARPRAASRMQSMVRVVIESPLLKI